MNQIRKAILDWQKKHRADSFSVDEAGSKLTANFDRVVGEQFFLRCLLIIEETQGLAQIIGTPDFLVPEEKISATNEHCSSLDTEEGSFFVTDDGFLRFSYVLSFDQETPFSESLIDELLRVLDREVAENALSIASVVTEDGLNLGEASTASLNEQSDEEDEVPDVIPMYQSSVNDKGETLTIKVRPITYALMTFVKDMLGEEDTIDITEDGKYSRWHYTTQSDDGSLNCSGLIKINEESETISIILKWENDGLITGRDPNEVNNFLISVTDYLDCGHVFVDRHGGLCYRHAIDVEGLASKDPDYEGPHLISPRLILNMFSYANTVLPDVVERVLGGVLENAHPNQIAEPLVDETRSSYDDFIKAHWGVSLAHFSDIMSTGVSTAKGPNTDAKASPTKLGVLRGQRAVQIKHGAGCRYRGANLDGYFLKVNNISQAKDGRVQLLVEFLWFGWKPDSGGMRIIIDPEYFVEYDDFDGYVVAELGRPKIGSERRFSPLKNILEDVARNQSWSENQEKGPGSNEFQITRERHEIAGDLHLKLVLRVDIEQSLIKVFAYPPPLLPNELGKLAAAKILAHELTCCTYSGHFEILEDPLEIRFRNVVDVSSLGSRSELLHAFNNLIATAEDAFAYPERIKAISALRLDKDIDEIIDILYNRPDEFPPAIWEDRTVF